MLLFQGFGVTTSLFINQGQVKLSNIHQLESLGEISYILFLTLNSVVTKATGKNICGSHILLRAQCGKVKVIDESNDLPVFLVYFHINLWKGEIIIRLQLQIKRFREIHWQIFIQAAKLCATELIYLFSNNTVLNEVECSFN